jgi:signal transduction histidine kinase
MGSSHSINDNGTTSGVTDALPLERKLPLLILGLLAIVLITSLIVSAYEIRRSAETSAADRLSGLVTVLGSLTEPTLEARLAAMRRVAQDTAVGDALTTSDRPASAAAQRALARLVTGSDSIAPRLWTADGRPVGNVSLETPAETGRLHDELHALATSGDSGHVSRLYPTKGATAFWMSVPVRRDGRTIGYLTQERVMNARPRPQEQMLRQLVGSDISMFYRNIDDDIWVEMNGAQVTPTTPAGRFNDKVTVGAHGAAGRVLMATERIADTPILITVEYPISAILARPDVTIRALAMIAVVLLLLGGGLALAVGRQLARPLVALTGAAEAIADGEYAQRVQARGPHEVGRLALAFNQMAERVEESSAASAAAVARLTESVETQEFLAEASRILAESMSDETLLAELVQHCVPALADYCSIYVADDSGALRRVETAHYDSRKQAAVEELVRRYEYVVDGPGEVPLVIRTQQPLVIPRLDRASIRGSARDETSRRLLDEVGPSSFLCVPLVARGRAFGAMAFTMTDSGREFGPDNLVLATELARRTSVAIDNAIIYRRSIALRLEAQAASNAKSDFLAKMSHEIRTPINAMLGYAELIEMGIAGPITEAQAKHLHRIRSSGEHLTALVNEILDLAKIEAGRMSVEPIVGIVADVSEAAMSLIRPQAASKGVELTARTPTVPPTEYIGDPQRVQQILTNLLSNAIKFTPAGGMVRIAWTTVDAAPFTPATPSPSWARIVVEDSGVGIAPHDLDRIFQPFVQVDAGYTRSHGGTGLGLTISRTLARMMGGEITVESEVGKGSRFTLWLAAPAAVQPRVSLAAERTASV